MDHFLTLPRGPFAYEPYGFSTDPCNESNRPER